MRRALCLVATLGLSACTPPLTLQEAWPARASVPTPAPGFSYQIEGGLITKFADYLKTHMDLSPGDPDYPDLVMVTPGKGSPRFFHSEQLTIYLKFEKDATDEDVDRFRTAYPVTGMEEILDRSGGHRHYRVTLAPEQIELHDLAELATRRGIAGQFVFSSPLLAKVTQEYYRMHLTEEADRTIVGNMNFLVEND